MSDPEKIGSTVRRIDKNIRLKGADPLTKYGYTQFPNHWLASQVISPNAKLVLIALLSYAWQRDRCFPGQETLSQRVGFSVRTVSRSISELKELGILEVRSRGLGRTNLYIIHVDANVDK